MKTYQVKFYSKMRKKILSQRVEVESDSKEDAIKAIQIYHRFVNIIEVKEVNKDEE